MQQQLAAVTTSAPNVHKTRYAVMDGMNLIKDKVDSLFLAYC